MKGLTPVELEAAGVKILGYLRSQFYNPFYSVFNLHGLQVCSFVDVMLHVDVRVELIRPAADLLACQGKIYQWFDVRTGLIRYLYRG